MIEKLRGLKFILFLKGLSSPSDVGKLTNKHNLYNIKIFNHVLNSQNPLGHKCTTCTAAITVLVVSKARQLYEVHPSSGWF